MLKRLGLVTVLVLSLTGCGGSGGSAEGSLDDVVSHCKQHVGPSRVVHCSINEIVKHLDKSIDPCKRKKHANADEAAKCVVEAVKNVL